MRNPRLTRHTPRALLSEALSALRRRHPLSGLAVGIGALTPLMALGNPTGGQVVAGSATINNAGSNRTIIDQSSQQAVINWQQFSVGAHQVVQFVQPNSSAVVLNRVVGGNISSIFGDITANGQVFLINPNGILFGRGASLDMSGLVASTFGISDQNFMQGNYVFTKAANAPQGMIINQGSITTARSGYVVLSGDYVENDGRIQAQSGQVQLAAGNGATLTLDKDQLISYTVDGATLARLAGVVNAGDIIATGGTVYMTGDVANALTATAVNNQGFIAARSIKGVSGTIVLSAEGGTLVNSGTLDANAGPGAGPTPGGTIVIHGDQHTELLPTSIIDAAGNGNGGFIELSGHTLGVRGIALTGKGGHLLLDPAIINIVSGTGNSNTTGSASNVGTGFIAQRLIAGSNVTLVASSSIHHVSGPSIKALTGNAALAKLDLETGSVSNCLGGSGVCVGGSPVITHGGGTIDLTGLIINIAGQFVAHAGSTSGRNGHVTLGDVTAGRITVTGEFITTGKLTANSGVLAAVVLRANGSSDDGGSITVNGNIVAPNGGVTLIEAGGQGIHVNGNVTAGGGTAELSASDNNANNAVVAGNVTGTTVIIRSKGAQTHGGSVSVGNLTATQFDVQVTATNLASGSQATHFQVKTGTITAAKSVTIDASDSTTRPMATVTTGAITAYTVPCTISDCNSGPVRITAPDATITVGTITDNGGLVNPGSVDIAGHAINVGNITTLGGKVTLTANGGASSIHGGSGGTAVRQTAGTTIKARAIDIGLSASYGGAITLANLLASSANAPAVIELTADANHRNSTITVNGNITVNGLANNGFSSAMPGVGVPFGARLLMEAGGNSTAAHTIKVNGAISLTARGAQFTDTGTSFCDCTAGNFFHTVQGKGGQAGMNISANGTQGSVAITGPLSVKGPQASVIVRSPVIKTGAITVTGTGETLSRASGQGNDSVSKIFGASHDSAGLAILSLAGSSDTGPANTVTTGNITVAGKGLAKIAINSQKVATGDITVSATAAKSSRSGALSFVSSASYNGRAGIGDVPQDTGTRTLGIADVVIGRSAQLNQEFAVPGQIISVGNVTVTGVGQAEIDLTATAIQAKSLTATATKGLMVGTGVSTSAGSRTAYTFNINGGQASITALTGLASTGAINITGNVAATGPAASVSLTGHAIKVSGNVAAVASGGAVTTDVVSTPSSGTGSHTHFSGPGNATTVSIGGGVSSVASINVGGIVSAKGPGLVGISIAGDKVTLGGLSASASVAAAYTALDTRISATTDAFTAGSAAILVDVTGPNGTFAPATVTGNVIMNAPHGNLYLPSQLNVGGQVRLKAGLAIGDDATVIGQHINEAKNISQGGSGSGSGSPAGLAQPMVVKAASMAMIAGGNISLTDSQLTIGNGVMTSIAGDPTLLSGLAGAGLAPLSSSPNGAFEAGGTLSLGGLNMTGTYLLLQGTSVSLLGPVSVPTSGFLVQVSPADPTGSVSIEDLPPISAASALVVTNVATSAPFALTNQGFLSLFSGDTVAVGGPLESGDVTIGANGKFDIGSTNLIIETGGSITGLSTVTSTGLVVSLLSLLGPPVPPVTAGEIDPSTSSGLGDQTDKKHIGQNGLSGGGQQGGTISNDDTGSGVCH